MTGTGRGQDGMDQERRLRFLVRAGTILAESITDYDTTLRNIAHLAVATGIAEICLFDVLEEGGRPRLAAVSSVWPHLEEKLHEAGRFLRSESGRPLHPVLRVILERTPNRVTTIY
jgi:hypothetical protein